VDEDVLNKVLSIQNKDGLSKFDFYNYQHAKIKESVIMRKSYSFVIGYEILKHFKNQKINKEKRKNKKSFNDNNLLNQSKGKLKVHKKVPVFMEEEEEIKSSKDVDSRKMHNSIKSIEKIDLQSYEVKRNIKVIKTNGDNQSPESSKYSKMLYFSNLRKMSKKLKELKELHKNYFLINYFNSSMVTP
jgi:hypothetical protein